MTFDPRAYLEKHRAEAGDRAIRATGAIPPDPSSTDSTNSMGQRANRANQSPDPDAAEIARIARIASPLASHGDNASSCALAASRPAMDPNSPTVRKLAGPPTHPPTCAICGATEWTVAMTDRDGTQAASLLLEGGGSMIGQSCTLNMEKRREIGRLMQGDWQDAFEERAAILEYDAGMTRAAAEARAVLMLNREYQLKKGATA